MSPAFNKLESIPLKEYNITTTSLYLQTIMGVIYGVFNNQRNG